ncbi:hypothetical protein [Burkholderia mayonis]|uniref:hypothetical protein n=1 Tax=Burkholderia mayonis TaxID=1385591 RepID=UPI000D368CF8|nr:hypothetical protein [Burkholderia mayonis]
MGRDDRCREENAAVECASTKTLFYQVTLSTVVVLPLTLLTGRATIAMDAAIAVNLAFRTFVLVLGTFLAWYRLLTKCLGPRLPITQFVTPIVGVALGQLLLDDELSVGFMCGAAMVVPGVVGIGVVEVLGKGKRARRTVGAGDAAHRSQRCVAVCGAALRRNGTGLMLLHAIRSAASTVRERQHRNAAAPAISSEVDGCTWTARTAPE